jgi:(S)-2-hydroxyglutarate dehydrogenase
MTQIRPGSSVLVVGGGIVGLATALQLQRAVPSARITLLEKESKFGQHQSTHNSGVLHCGLYYKPGSLKARLAVEGVRQMTAFCREHGVAHEICGKLVLATDEVERTRLQELFERGTRNGLQGLELLTPAEFTRREPAVRGVAGLLVPEEGIVDYAQVIATMSRLATERGITLLTSARVRKLSRHKDQWLARSEAGEFSAEWLVNCAGLHCDRVAKLAGARPGLQIVPFRGDYYRLREDRAELVRHLIYPVPDPTYPFLGVHFTRLVRGGIECGPNAMLALNREGYPGRGLNLRDALQIGAFPGFWRFLARHRGQAWDELCRSLSKQRFCEALQKLVPEVTAEDLEPGGRGVRAQAMTARGELVSDFHLVREHQALHVLNAPSPAATASLAIGQYITNQLLGTGSGD